MSALSELGFSPEFEGTKQEGVWIFPGQGGLEVGVGKIEAEESKRAQEVFQKVDRIVGGERPFSSLIFEGPQDELVYSPNAHVALVAVGIAKLVHGIETGKIKNNPQFVIGCSAGLIPAMVASGVVGLEDGIRIAQERGRLTQEASDGLDAGMETVIAVRSAVGQIEGLAQEACKIEMEEKGGIVAVSGIYSPVSIGITGDRQRIAGVNQRLKDVAKTIRPQSGITIVSHSPYMIPASRKMQEFLATVDVKDPWYPLVMNGVKVTDGETVKKNLPWEMVEPVRLTASVEEIMQSESVSSATEFSYGLRDTTPWARFFAETVGDRVPDFQQHRI